MRRFWKGSLGLMAVLALAGCGGAVEEATEVPVSEVEQGLACPIDGSCPGTTVCVNGLCRDCVRQPQFCQ